jgi:hypothetical protein
MSHRLLHHAGLTRPYRFERILAIVTAVVLAIAIAAAAAVLAANDELNRHTPREDYFVYLAALALAGALFAPWPRLSMLVLSLATIEFGLGIGSLILKEAGFADSTIVANNYNEDPRFIWHPLLQGTPIPSISVPVVANRVTHNSAGLRGKERDPAVLGGQSVIAVYGGSTTYDIGVTDDDTWANQLELLLGPDRYAVLNHGVPGYSTVEHVVQTAFYQNAFDIQPRCSLYYIGWNDVREMHIPHLDPAFARFHLRSQIDALQVRRFGAAYLAISPLLTILIRQVSAWTDTARPPRVLEAAPMVGPDPALDRLYLRNVRSISKMNRDRGIRTIWVGQVLNVDELENGKQSNEIDGWIPLMRNKDVWPALHRLNELLRHEAGDLDDVYIDVPVAAFEPSDFYDNGHFLAPGSRKLARFLAPAVAEQCR